MDVSHLGIPGAPEEDEVPNSRLDLDRHCRDLDRAIQKEEEHQMAR